MVYYYTITIIAQMLGAYNQITGKSKPFGKRQKVPDKIIQEENK